VEWTGERFFVGRLALLTAMLAISVEGRGAPGSDDAGVRLMTLDPGHFHASLIQKEMYPGVSDVVHVYAPLGADLNAHLQRIAQFNLRAERPTRWRLEIHTGPDFFERMLKERPGNVVVLSGRNQGKIDRIVGSVEAGLNVLADKPWVITAADLPKLESALDTAEAKGLVAYDVMTERYEVATMLQRELVGDAAVSGPVLRGSETEPGVVMESVHHVMKTVAGVPNLRPAWFFDTSQQGEALADVGTHLVDLVPWMLFPEQAIDYHRDIQVLAARRWPTLLSREELERVTGEKGIPPLLAPAFRDGRLPFEANTAVSYTLRGIHVQLTARWNYEAPEGGGDTHFAAVRGSRARVEIRQGAEQRYRTELYVIPVRGADMGAVRAALESRLQSLQGRLPGLGVEALGNELHVLIPDALRTSHESHFAQVTSKFLSYLADRASLPRWERANMLAKYYVTTRGTELSRQSVP
jgi:predicted dehydrogenase